MRCKTCHYLLEGLSENRCPECGREFDPNDSATFEATGAISTPRPRLWYGAVMFTLFSSCCGGFNYRYLPRTPNVYHAPVIDQIKYVLWPSAVFALILTSVILLVWYVIWRADP